MKLLKFQGQLKKQFSKVLNIQVNERSIKKVFNI